MEDFEHFVDDDSFYLMESQPLGKFKVFWLVTEHIRVWGDPGGSGGSENHVWKIFYRALFEIGTPGTPRGVLRNQNFFKKNSWEKLLGYM